MKVKASIKRLCEACRIVKRRGRLYVICKDNPKVTSGLPLLWNGTQMLINALGCATRPASWQAGAPPAAGFTPCRSSLGIKQPNRLPLHLCSTSSGRASTLMPPPQQQSSSRSRQQQQQQQQLRRQQARRVAGWTAAHPSAPACGSSCDGRGTSELHRCFSRSVYSFCLISAASPLAFQSPLVCCWRADGTATSIAVPRSVQPHS